MSASVTASAPPRYRVENFPPEMVADPRWCVFQVTPQPGRRPKKTPLIAGVRPQPGVRTKAEVDDPSTLRPFDVALADAEVRGLYLAYAIAPESGIFLADADEVITPEGFIRPDIIELGEALSTYTEWSLSGDGLHIIGKGRFPEHSANRPVPDGCHTLERYPLRGGRFVILTGDTLAGHETMRDCGDVLASLFPPRAAKTPDDSANGDGYHGTLGELSADETEGIIVWDGQHRQDGRRHHMSLYLSAYMGKQGVSREQALAIAERCAADDSDPGAKLTACNDTYDDLEAGETVKGWHGLKDIGLTDDDLAPLKAILDGFWQRHQATITRGTDRRREQASAACDVPAFPVDVLPERVRRFVDSATAAIGCPVDFVGIPILGLAEGVMGKSRRIVIRPGFEVSPGSWYGVIADPGTGKSPGLKYALRVVTPLQDEAWLHYRDRLDAWESLPKDERGEKPQPEHFFITDSTGEALWAALGSSSGVAQVEDELRRRLKALDAYRQAGDRQAMLSLWSNSPVKIVRRTSAPVYIPFPVAPLVGGIQPGVLKHLRGEGDDAEADDGWVPRFLLSWPDAEPLALSDVAFDERTIAPVVEIFRGLRLSGSAPHDTRLSEAAYASFRDWHERNRQLQKQSRGLERQWAAKAPFHLARLALVLHLLEGQTADRQDLPDDTMRDAIRLLSYFRRHLARVLPSFGANALGREKIRIIRILATSKSKDEAGWVSRSDINNGLRNVTPNTLTAALAELEDEGKIEKEVRPTSTKPSEWWRIVGFSAGENSGYSDYSQTGPQNEDLAA